MLDDLNRALARVAIGVLIVLANLGVLAVVVVLIAGLMQ